MCRVVSTLLLVVSEREKSLIKCEKGIFSLFGLTSTNQEYLECIPIKDLVKYMPISLNFFLCNKEPTKILCLWIHQIGLVFFTKVRTGQKSLQTELDRKIHRRITTSVNNKGKCFIQSCFFFSSSRNIILNKKHNIV